MPDTAIVDDQKRRLQFSVKKDDYQGDTIQFIMPYHRYDYALPPELPAYNEHYGYYHSRERILLTTPRHEGQWANAVAIAIAKIASLAWAVEGSVPLRINRAQQWLLNAGAGMGIFGWVPFLGMHLGGYLATGRGIIEIERATPANGSRVVNVHHLNPLRCRLTGNPQYPVNYLAKDGKVRKLGWHQVIIIIDMPDSTEGELGVAQGAAERAYKHVLKMSAIENYVYEKVTGRRPQAIYFIGGAVQRLVNDAVTGAEQSADRKGVTSFMGAAITTIPGDVPLSLVTIPLAELPDGFDAAQERDRADLIYANSIGLDPQDLNPTLIGSQGLGSTGNQSVVLARKQKGRGLSAWMAQFTQALNELAMQAALFTFSDPSSDEKKTEAETSKLNAETRKIQVESGEITPDQARNLAVDAGDLPREFLEEDVTGGNVVTDTDKPLAENPTSRPDPSETNGRTSAANGRDANATEREREKARAWAKAQTRKELYRSNDSEQDDEWEGLY